MLWRVLILLLVGCVDVALFGKMMWGSGGIVEYQALKSQYSALQQQIAALDAENMALSLDIRLLQSDDKYVEKMVRQKLRYLRDNEVVYIFPQASTRGTESSNHDSKN